MSERRRTTLGAVSLALGLAVLAFMLLLTAVHAVGTDAGLYYQLQMQAQILPDAGIAGEELRALDGRMAAYLAGDRAALEENPPFNAREMTHMADCYDLFALLRKVRRRLIPWAVLLIVGGFYLLRNRRMIRRTAWLSPLILLIPLGAFGIWAAVNFNGAFTFFHRVLFTNDLWLLDPRTNLLIRICPQSMFMAMGLRIALWGLAALVGIPAAVTALTWIWPKNKQDEANSWNDNRTMRRAAAQRQKTFDFGEKR